MEVEENISYVYALLDPRIPGPFYYSGELFHCEPFYIGKGKRNRVKTHTLRAKKGLQPHSDKANRIRSILSEGFNGPEIIFLQNDLSNEVALEHEEIYVAKIGRLITGEGPLLNKCPGGKGDYKRLPKCDGPQNAFYKKAPTKAIEASLKARIGVPHSDERKKIISDGVLKVRHKLSGGAKDRAHKQVRETITIVLEQGLELNEENYMKSRKTFQIPTWINLHKYITDEEVQNLLISRAV